MNVASVRDPAVAAGAALCALGAVLAAAGDGGAWLQLVVAGAAFAAAYATTWSVRLVAGAGAVGYLAVELAAGRVSFAYYWKDALALALGAAAVFAGRALAQRTSGALAEAAAARAEVAELVRGDEIEALLTGGRFLTLVERELLRSRRHDHQASVALLRPDGIDELATGDREAAERTLHAVATVVAEQLRTSDAGFRRGPHELGVLLPETDLAGARVAAERLRLAVAETGGSTVSVGVAAYPFSNAAEDLESHAAEALAEAVRQGGNRTVLSARTPGAPPGWSLAALPEARDSTSTRG